MDRRSFGSGLAGSSAEAARRALRLAGCGIALLCAAAPAGAVQWISNGPTGGVVLALSVDPTAPSTVYAATNGGGFFKSTNGGVSWTAINTGVAEPGNFVMTGLSVDPLDPARVYASGYSGLEGGVFASTDGGASWAYTELGHADDIAVAGDPVAPDTLYAAAGPLRRSSDGGASWTDLLPANFYTVTVDPTAPTTVYAGSYGSIWKSINGGTTWDWMGVGLGSNAVKAIAVDPTTPDVVYAGIEGHGVYKTLDGGYEWTPVGPAVGASKLSVTDLAIDPEDSETVYAAGLVAGGVGVYKSTDGGASWTGTPLEHAAFALALAPTAPAHLIAGTGEGVWQSGDAGASWSASNTGMVNVAMLSLAAASPPGRAYAGAWNGKIFRSDDGGASWLRLPVPAALASHPSSALAVDPTDSSVVYAGSLGANGVFKSSDGGLNWSPLSTGSPPLTGYSLVVDPTEPDIVYAGAFGGVYRSTQGGNDWVHTGGLFAAVVSLAIDPAAPGTLYAGHDPLNGGGFPMIFKTTSSGELWSPVNEGLPSVSNAAVQALAVDPASGAVYAGLEELGVYKSTNGGASWAPANDGLTNLDVTSLQVDPGLTGTVYAGTRGGGVFQSVNGSTAWAPINDGLHNPHVAALALAGPGRLLAATAGNGVFIVSACADGLDNDGDGLVDHPADPGCVSALANRENPQCDDDLDNDGDGSVDWDGGPAAVSPDPQCKTPSQDREGNACGMGGEVVIALWLLVAFRRAWRSQEPRASSRVAARSGPSGTVGRPHMRRFVYSLVSLLCWAPAAVEAEPIRVSFAGTVTEIAPQIDDGTFALGDPVSGSFVIESETADGEPAPEAGSYEDAVGEWAVSFGSYQATASTGLLHLRNGMTPSADEFYVEASPAGADVAGLPLFRSILDLLDLDFTVFASDAIPTAVPLAEFEHKTVRLEYADPPFSYPVRAEITSFEYELAPEPGALPSLAAGALVLGLRRRCALLRG
jgi:photosystem II stability/assembly factor-like uncharacterized protein